MILLQGTTPPFVISVPEIPVTSIIGIELMFYHKGAKTKHDLSDVTVDAEENTLTYNFTETETLALDPDFPLFWQLRIKTASGIVGTLKEEINVEDLISEEVME